MVLTYSFAGLTVSSDIPLPALAAQNGGRVDIAIVRETNRPIPVFDVEFSGGNWAIGKDGWSLQGEAGLHLFQKGTQLHVWSDGDPTGPLSLPWILGSGMAASLLRCGHVPWHASAVDLGGKAFLTMGESGNGKSTAAMALIHRGGELLADDMVCPRLQLGRAEMQPAFLSLRLLGDTAQHFDVSTFPLDDKQPVIVPKAKDDSAREIAAVFVLAKRRSDEGAVERLPKAVAFAELIRNLFARPAVPLFSRMDDAIAIARGVVACVPVYHLAPPEGLENMVAFMDRVMTEVLRGE